MQIDWNNLARRARQITVPGDSINGLVSGPTGATIAFNLSGAAAAGGGRGGGGAAATTAGVYVLNVDTNALTRMPAGTPADTGAGRGGRGAAAAAAAPAGASLAFTRDGRTLYFRTGSALFSAPAGGGGGNAPAAAPAAGGGGGRGGRGGGGGAAAAAPAEASGTARQVTYTASIQVDKKALRAQVFNEGWRIMKNRFYDSEMNGVNWATMRTKYAALVDSVVDEEELHTLMMMMIGELNASHTGVSGGPSDAGPSLGATRNPGFDVVPDPSGFYRVGRHLQDRPGRSRLSEGAPGRLHHRARRSRPEDDGQLLAAADAAVHATSCGSS